MANELVLLVMNDNYMIHTRDVIQKHELLGSSLITIRINIFKQNKVAHVPVFF